MKVEVGPYALGDRPVRDSGGWRASRSPRAVVRNLHCGFRITRTWCGLSDAAIVHAGMSEIEQRFSRDFQRDFDVGAGAPSFGPIARPIVALELGGLETGALF